MAKRKDKKQAAEKSEFEEKVIFINRCTKVVKGGRKFSFSALIVIGDGKGRVGLGFAKANEVADAIRKGGESARKNLITFEMDKGTIPHDTEAKWDGARVLLKRSNDTGVVAGSSMRQILEMGGVKDIVAKSLGSNNPVNQVRATFLALSTLASRQSVLNDRNGNHETA